MRNRLRRLGIVVGALALAACSSVDPTGPPAGLTILGSGSPPPTSSIALRASARENVAQFGDPEAVLIGMYSMFVSPRGDCRDAILVQDFGPTPVVKDMLTNPVLFQGNPGAGSYPCIVFRMSDVLRVRPESTFGACEAGTVYSGDIYREGETDWVDIDGNPIIGRGTDEDPVDDQVYIFITQHPDQALERGVSPHQLLELNGALIVPGQNTFYYDSRGVVRSDEYGCGMEPGQVGFY